MRYTYFGYSDLGPVRVPPLPMATILTDRTTGQQLFLTQQGEPGSMSVLLSPNGYRWPDKIIYGPHDGPYLDGYRVFVQSGLLGMEPVGNISSPPLYTRAAWARRLLRLQIIDGAFVTFEEHIGD